MARAPQKAGEVKLENLSLVELLELQSDLVTAVAERRETERAALKEKMAQMASESGLSMDEVLGTSKSRKASGSVAPKFRNPENPAETWSGRGRKPNWLVERLKKKGVTVQDFAI